MAENNLNPKIPGQSIIYMVVCLVGILILIFGGVVPAHKTQLKLDDEILALKRQTDDRKVLVPLYLSLQKDSEQRESVVLALPPKGRLSPSRMNTLPHVFRTAAKASGISRMSSVPNLKAVTGDAQLIPVNVNLRGDIKAFRTFLIRVGGIPYVHHIEEMEAQVGPDNRDYKLKIWIAVG